MVSIGEDRKGLSRLMMLVFALVERLGLLSLAQKKPGVQIPSPPPSKIHCGCWVLSTGLPALQLIREFVTGNHSAGSGGEHGENPTLFCRPSWPDRVRDNLERA